MTEPERRVTAIERQRRNPERVNLFLDGAFALGLPQEAVVKAGIRVGQVLTVRELEELQELNETARATETAIRLLTSRPRSTSEIRAHLHRATYDGQVIEAVMARLRDWRYVDDDAFARYWVENRERHRPRSRRLLEQELRQKGIEREAVAEAIDAAAIDETRGALEIARLKLRTYGSVEPEQARRRLIGYLGRRGYGYDVIRRVLDELFEADPEAWEEP